MIAKQRKRLSDQSQLIKQKGQSLNDLLQSLTDNLLVNATKLNLQCILKYTEVEEKNLERTIRAKELSYTANVRTGF